MNLKNIKNNLDVLVNYAKNSRIMAVVKADAYGAGIKETAKFLSPYVDYYAVANASEGVSLRSIDRLTPVLVFIYNDEEILICAENNLTMSVSCIDDLRRINEVLTDSIIDVHIAVNSGMNRYGVSNIIEFESMLEYIKQNKSIRLTGIYSHLYDNVKSNNDSQISTFDRYVSVAKNYKHNILAHLSASNGVISSIDKYDMVRLGIKLYSGDETNFKDSIEVISTIQSIRHVKKGEFVGYSCHYIAKCDIIVGVVYGGYADGLDKRLSGYNVEIEDSIAPIIGDICMDVFFVDITNVYGARVGSTVTIIGGKSSIDDVARYMGTSNYEVLTSFRGRCIRSYI